MKRAPRRQRRLAIPFTPALVAAALLSALATGDARAQQTRGTPEGEWRYWGGDAWSTRYSPLEQVNAANFEDLEVAWTWRGDNYGPEPTYVMRGTPTYVNGTVYVVAGTRRTVVAIDPETGETLWTFREPHTFRWEETTRQNYGKAVAYAEIDGRGVIYTTSPAFFLHALDAKTGLPLEGFGKPVPVEGFGEYGTVDMLADLDRVGTYDPYYGPDKSIGLITTSSPPIVVDGVVIVGSAGAQGSGNQSRIENIPGDILAYDARTGAHLWTFHVIPRPGEFGHDSWENDAWSYSGNINAWAPLSADLERGIVYIPTDAPTNDGFGGFRPGNNLFGNSIVALDARTGQRVWHFQTVHHDLWDRDNPVAPILMDLTVDGRPIPAAIQVTKHGFVFAFNRETGEPIWPIEEMPVPPSEIPGERASPTQPYPTKPAPYDIQGLTVDDLVDFTPELRQLAIEATRDLKFGPLFNPPLHEGNAGGYRGAATCPTWTGGANIIGGAAADPETGILYIASVKTCTSILMVPGSSVDDGRPETSSGGTARGRTVVDWTRGPGSFNGIQGIPLLKPPYGRITAIDMNTGEHLWWIPNGDTPDEIANHPLLQGVTLPNTGQPSHATALATRSLLMKLPVFRSLSKWLLTTHSDA